MTNAGLPELLQLRFTFAGESQQQQLTRLEEALQGLLTVRGEKFHFAGSQHAAFDASTQRLARLAALEGELRGEVEGWAVSDRNIAAWLLQLDGVCAQLQKLLSGAGSSGESVLLPAVAPAPGNSGSSSLPVSRTECLPSPQLQPVQSPELVVAVALYAVLNTSYGGLRAGAVELRNLTSKSHSPAAKMPAGGHSEAQATVPHSAASVAATVLSLLAAAPSVSPDRDGFDAAHERWRAGRDDCEALLLQAAKLAPAAEKEQLAAAWTLQQRLAALIDGASRL